VFARARQAGFTTPVSGAGAGIESCSLSGERSFDGYCIVRKLRAPPAIYARAHGLSTKHAARKQKGPK
jgi:hypothetical protein